MLWLQGSRTKTCLALEKVWKKESNDPNASALQLHALHFSGCSCHPRSARGMWHVSWGEKLEGVTQRSVDWWLALTGGGGYREGGLVKPEPPQFQNNLAPFFKRQQSNNKGILRRLSCHVCAVFVSCASVWRRISERQLKIQDSFVNNAQQLLSQKKLGEFEGAGWVRTYGILEECKKKTQKRVKFWSFISDIVGKTDMSIQNRFTQIGAKQPEKKKTHPPPQKWGPDVLGLRHPHEGGGSVVGLSSLSWFHVNLGTRWNPFLGTSCKKKKIVSFPGTNMNPLVHLAHTCSSHKCQHHCANACLAPRPAPVLSYLGGTTSTSGVAFLSHHHAIIVMDHDNS